MGPHHLFSMRCDKQAHTAGPPSRRQAERTEQWTGKQTKEEPWMHLGFCYSKGEKKRPTFASTDLSPHFDTLLHRTVNFRMPQKILKGKCQKRRQSQTSGEKHSHILTLAPKRQISLDIFFSCLGWERFHNFPCSYICPSLIYSALSFFLARKSCLKSLQLSCHTLFKYPVTFTDSNNKIQNP